jgi:hypothetical protein
MQIDRRRFFPPLRSVTHHKLFIVRTRRSTPLI